MVLKQGGFSFGLGAKRSPQNWDRLISGDCTYFHNFMRFAPVELSNAQTKAARPGLPYEFTAMFCLRLV